MSDLLKIDKLSISLKELNTPLVTDISFSLSAGKSLILLGQSGSGKTMICSGILNLLDRKKFCLAGSIRLNETELLGLSDRDKRKIYGREIAYIPQNPMTALDPSQKIGSQMDETLRLHSDKNRKERREHILNMLCSVGLTEPERVYRAHPYVLSGGMLQRVIIAMAMMLNVKFVIADEPTTALDVVHRNGIIELFNRMKEKGTGILMVSHDFATAVQLGGEMLVMKEGKIIESGEVSQVFEKSQNSYTRALIDAYSLHGIVEKGAGND